MFIFLIVLIAIIAVIMTLLVLVQSGKGGGLAGIASGGATTQILGARQAPDILEKATWTLAVIFIVLCILTNFTIDKDAARESVIQQRTQQEGLPVQPETVPPPTPDAVPAPVETTPPAGEQTPEQ